MNKLINKIINQKSEITLDKTSIGSYEDILDIEEISINNLVKLFNESESIIKLMTDNYLNYNNKLINLKNISNITTKLLLIELKNFPSFDSNNSSNNLSIYNEIKKVNIKKEYELSLNENIKFNIYFYYSREDELFVNNQVSKLIKIIYVFCNSFGKKILNKINKFKIRFLIIDFPRKLDFSNYPDSNLTFDELSKYGIFNNSSGYTNKQTKEMVLSRKSGLNGLLIHELIHLLDLDFHFWDHDLPNVDKFNWKKEWTSKCNMLECTKEIKSNCGYYSFTEAICNTTSSYLLAIYSGIELYMNRINKVNSKEYDKIKKLATMFYVIEYIHSYINSCKLLKYFGYDSYDSFFNNTSNRKYYQDAHVFEYIILRTFIISYYYQIIFKKLKSYIDGKNQNSLENYKFQKKINDFIFDKMIKKDIKPYFDYIFRINKVDSNTYSIEYFATNFIKK